MQLQNEECNFAEDFSNELFTVSYYYAYDYVDYDGSSSSTNAFRVQFFKFSPNNVDQYSHTHRTYCIIKALCKLKKVEKTQLFFFSDDDYKTRHPQLESPLEVFHLLYF